MYTNVNIILKYKVLCKYTYIPYATLRCQLTMFGVKMVKTITSRYACYILYNE